VSKVLISLDRPVNYSPQVSLWGSGREVLEGRWSDDEHFSDMATIRPFDFGLRSRADRAVAPRTSLLRSESVEACQGGFVCGQAQRRERMDQSA
jgi:hypothetical protein